MKRGAHVLILDPNGALILQQRDNTPGITNPGTISAWGGGIEADEEPIDAAIREIHEELGLTVKPSDLKFWRMYKKTQAVHGSDVEVYLFTLNERLDPKDLTVYEGTGYALISPNDNLDAFNLTALAKQFVGDFFAESSQPSASDDGSTAKWFQLFQRRPKN